MSCVVQTQTCGTLQLDTTMTGINPHKKSTRTKAAASGFANGSNFVRDVPGFSLSQTEPIQGNHSGQFWNDEGQQYLNPDPISPHGNAQHGFPDSFSFHDSKENLTGQTISQGSVSGSTRDLWNNVLSATHLESVEMSRFPSQDSIGAHSQRTSNSFDQSRSSRLYPNVNQMTFNMPSARSDMSDRSNSPVNTVLYTPTQPTDLQGFSTYPYPGDDMSGANPMFHRNSNASIAQPMNVSLPTGPYNLYTTSGEEAFVSLTAESDILTSQGPDGTSMMYNPGTIMGSPTLWDTADYLEESRRSSPVMFEEQWSLPAAPITASATNSPLDYSPSLEAISPRYVEDFPDLVELPPYTTTGDRVMRKPIGPRPSKVASDLAAGRRQRTSETVDESSMKLVGRSSIDADNTARDHHLYHNVTPQADGLYHCPWEKDPTSNCQHKPEKLKCNYDKFVDSHLKPYKCKIHTCKELQFSSTACLLRHEREAHAMHGHGDKPFLCSYDGCERGVQGNGFPRHWNLRDHMKRVHNDPGHPKSNASGSPPPSAPVSKSKKRKAGDNSNAESSSFVPEKAPKRVASPPVVMRQPQTKEPSLLERYQEKHRLLLSTVEQLADPKHADNMKLLREAADCIKVMAQTTQRIHATPSAIVSWHETSVNNHPAE